MPAFKRLTPAQAAVYLALRQLSGELTVTPNDARPLHALRRRGLVRFARDASGVKVARLRPNRATRRRLRRLKAGQGLYRPLVEGLFIPEIDEGIL